jgi:hypothetical protein
MRDDQQRFLNLLGQLPARLNVEQVAWVLNCQAHDVPVLVTARLLKPLGNPPQNGTKFFATHEVLELMRDEKWLNRITVAIYEHWHKRNTRKKESPQSEDELVLSSAT